MSAAGPQTEPQTAPRPEPQTDTQPEAERARALLAAAGPAWRAAQAWETAAHEGQRPKAFCDDGRPWTTWLFLGGRGAGKTRAGAEWVAETAQALGPGGRIALVGATMADARAVMVEGPSGLLNLPFRSGTRFEPSLRRVIFPGGAVGQLFSAAEPERLRGPQFHTAWGDELCAWTRGAETLAMLRLGLRLTLAKGANARLAARSDLRSAGGQAQPRCLSADGGGSGEETGGWIPRLVLTSTPKPTRLLRGVLAEPGLVRTDAPTRANADNLAPGFLATMQALYGGTRRAAQELEGRVLAVEGALFTAEMIEGARRSGAANSLAVRFDRVAVAVDPPAGTLSGRARDACGIVVAGRIGFGREARAVVLADLTVSGLSPEGWAARVRRAAEAHAADRVVVETNQGGAMAEAVLRASGLSAPIRRVHASLGKAARAEPVAALYEQGRVAHADGLEALEEELMGLGGEAGGSGETGGGSPDRADALVWAITDLMLGPAGEGPRLRVL